MIILSTLTFTESYQSHIKQRAAISATFQLLKRMRKVCSPAVLQQVFPGCQLYDKDTSTWLLPFSQNLIILTAQIDFENEVLIAKKIEVKKVA